MTQDDAYALEAIRKWVWSGFYSAQEVREMLPDILKSDENPLLLERAIDEAFAQKRTVEAGWPETTDCDRLDRAFYKLHEVGICALHNAGYTMSDGYSDVSEAVAQAPAGHYHGFCFYHGQDVERAVDGHGLMIAFGDLCEDDAAGVRMGRAVVAALQAERLKAEWNGTMETRIDLLDMDWRRRGPPNFSFSDVTPGAQPSAEPGPLPTPWWQFWR